MKTMMGGSRRRSRLEIYIDILNAVLNGEEKFTRIMYAVKLSSQSTRRSLNNLVEEGYIDAVPHVQSRKTKRTYTITAKGVRALRYFEGAEKLLDIDRVMLQ